MKKYSIILLLTVISVFSAGSFFIYKVCLSAHRSEVRSFINDNQNSLDLTILSINPSELYTDSKTLKWEDDNKEVVYQGKLFDVVSVSSENGHVTLKLLSDETEKQINEEYASVFSSSANSSDHPLKLLKQFLALKFLSDPSQVFANLNSSESTDSFDSFINNLPSTFISCEVPPPDQA